MRQEAHVLRSPARVLVHRDKRNQDRQHPEAQVVGEQPPQQSVVPAYWRADLVYDVPQAS